MYVKYSKQANIDQSMIIIIIIKNYMKQFVMYNTIVYN